MLMNTAGITDRIFNFARLLVGHISGGLAHANVLASIIFAGMSGAAVADAGGLGQVEIKAMKDQGYDPSFAAAVTAASSTIGPIIPPSVPIIIYASLAEESVGRLFLGGVIPGLMMGISLVIVIFIITNQREYPKDPIAGIGQLWRGFKAAFWPMMTPAIILGGIGGGVFTATEGAAVAALYAFILGVLIYKEVRIKDIPGILVDTMSITAVMLFILSTINSISWILVLEDVTGSLADNILAITQEPWLILLIVNVFLLLLGMILEGLPIMVLTIPILLPLMDSIGVDPIHFGVVMMVNIMIGGITPPIGMLLFITSRVADLQVEKLMKSIIPFIIPLAVVLILITYIPGLVTIIPDLLIK
jgi:tripartite ATP-independent transporter DctM subunit